MGKESWNKIIIVLLIIAIFVSHFPPSTLMRSAVANGIVDVLEEDLLLEKEMSYLDVSAQKRDSELVEGSFFNIGNEVLEFQGDELLLSIAEYQLGETVSRNSETILQEESGDDCNVVAEGQFTDQEGVNGLPGAKWRLCDDGVLIVNEGFIGQNWIWLGTPWFNYQADIYKIEFTGSIIAGRYLSNLFNGLSNVTVIEGLRFFDTTEVTYMNSMFSNMESLTELDVSGWNVSQVTNMHGLFSGASSLTELDVSGWDTSRVTYMTGLFFGAWSLTELDLSSWDTSQVIDMRSMFTRAGSLTELDLSSWDTGQVTDMSSMFSGAWSLTELDVSSWNTSQVTNMSFMFNSVGNLTELDVSGWNVSQVTNMSDMFNWASSLAELDVSGWNVSQVTNMRRMFCVTSSLEELDVSEWDTGQVREMQAMFYRANSLEELDVSGWDISSVRYISSMFRNASSLEELDVSGWDTSQVRDMRSMFEGASSLTELDVSSWDTSRVKDMRSMFEGVSNLTELDVSGWDTSLAYMSGMFNGATSLRQLTFGENFAFIGFPSLPEVPQNLEFTGYWQNVGNGTINNPLGMHVMTSFELGEHWWGVLADTFVWQPVNRSVTTPRVTLGELIAAAEARVQVNYTPRSWANLMSMLTFARNIYDNPTATDAQINNAIDLLRARLNELVER